MLREKVRFFEPFRYGASCVEVHRGIAEAARERVALGADDDRVVIRRIVREIKADARRESASQLRK